MRRRVKCEIMHVRHVMCFARLNKRVETTLFAVFFQIFYSPRFVVLLFVDRLFVSVLYTIHTRQFTPVDVSYPIV